MKSSICQYSAIPVRCEPDERSELETQILFGEVFYRLEESGNWVRIKMDYDGYEGWIVKKLFVPVNDSEVKIWLNSEGKTISAPFATLIREPYKAMQIISGGSRIVFNGEDRNSFSIANREYYLQNLIPERKSDLVEVAKGFLNTWYLWGGRSSFGIDCSGLTQIVFKIMGYQIPRNASQQCEQGSFVEYVEEARAGDLAFFTNGNSSSITHTGICLGKGRILHASGEVRIDHLDHKGIYSRERQSYTHQKAVIKRIIE
ncbi:C40 family peptidase [Marinilabiliaceae bacterium ANBcel2]|nr:C40 family peptidase [Marinilabiliaceae bacterium ANBcel2]